MYDGSTGTPDDAGALRARLGELEAENARQRRELEAARSRAALSDAVLESATDYAVFTVDPGGRVTGWNAGAERLLGWGEAEALGMDCRATFTPEDRERGAPERERAAAAAEGRAEDERWHVRKDGGRFRASGLLLPLRGAAGPGFLKVMRDVTGRALAEERLRASEERFRRALGIETVGVIFFDLEGRITEANDAFLAMGGYDRGDVAAGRLRWDALTPPEWMPASRRALEELEATGRTTPYEKEYFRKDGSRWWGLFAATRLGEDEAVEFVLDVTERRRAEERLREGEERFRQFGEASSDVLWVRDAETLRYEYLSPAFEAVYGVGRGRVPGDDGDLGRWAALIHPEDREAALGNIARVRAGERVTHEFRVVRPSDGRCAGYGTPASRSSTRPAGCGASAARAGRDRGEGGRGAAAAARARARPPGQERARVCRRSPRRPCWPAARRRVRRGVRGPARRPGRGARPADLDRLGRRRPGRARGGDAGARTWTAAPGRRRTGRRWRCRRAGRSRWRWCCTSWRPTRPSTARSRSRAARSAWPGRWTTGGGGRRPAGAAGLAGGGRPGGAGAGTQGGSGPR
jgi:PAS domain S-box-containing protein